MIASSLVMYSIIPCWFLLACTCNYTDDKTRLLLSNHLRQTRNHIKPLTLVARLSSSIEVCSSRGENPTTCSVML